MRLIFILILLTLSVSATARTREFVTVKDEQFFLDGKVWHPYGTMYTPLYAQPGEGKPPLDWIEAYDPEMIDKDLDLMKQLGFNTVRITTSTFYHEKKQDEDWSTSLYKTRFNDFLDRLGKRGMKAEVFIHYYPKNSRYIPMAFDMVADPAKRSQSLAITQKLIKELGLANRHEILSYEMDWEPFIGDEGLRNATRWQGYDIPLILWNRWIIDQYGSVENAEKCWGYMGVKDAGSKKDLVSAPTDEQVMSDGPWTRKTVAYRRFCEGLINRKYALITSAIREVDPNHLVCAQRVLFQDKSPDHSKTIPYPIRHTSAFLDYFGYSFSPKDTWGLFSEESYLKDDDLFRKQGFGVRYSRFGKPVIYDEHGASVYYSNFPEQKEAHLENIQNLHYRRMHEIGREFGIDGMIAWWWIGRRPMSTGDGERSDWGILRPDGSMRPCRDALKETSQRLNELGKYQPDSTVVIDEFKHCDESDMYAEGKKLFMAELQKGRKPEVTTPYWGTDSSNCPLTCLCGLRSHKNCPPRALNGVFGKVEVLGNDGKWILAEYGNPLPSNARKPVTLRLAIANTGDALWLADASYKGNAGTVVVTWQCGTARGEIPLERDVSPNGTMLLKYTLPENIDSDVVLKFDAKERTGFGEVFRLTIGR